MFLVVGLGNPGSDYTNTRHNVGFMAADILSSRYNFSWINKPKLKSEIASKDSEFGKIYFCKPTTFMNLSGSAVLSITSFYKIPIEKIIVLHDDLDLPIGKIKYKIGGGAGGHNGLKSIDNAIGPNYQRIRIGIGKPEHKNHDVSNYVLSKFTIDEEIEITKALEVISQNFELLLSSDIEGFKRLMN